MSDAKVQIYGMVHSQNVLGPLMIATHYKLGEMAFTNLFEDRTPEFKAMNPFNKCPVLKDGEFVIAESSACLRYLAMKYVPSLYPTSDPQTCGRIDWAIDSMHCEIYAAWDLVVYVRCGFTPAPADQGAANDKLNAVVDAWLDTFVKGKKFVGGDALTIADFKAVPFLICLSHKALAKVGYAPTSAERIQAYVDAFFAEVPCATMMKSAEGHSILEFLDGLEP